LSSFSLESSTQNIEKFDSVHHKDREEEGKRESSGVRERRKTKTNSSHAFPSDV
jgi:hypothetical protein